MAQAPIEPTTTTNNNNTTSSSSSAPSSASSSSVNASTSVSLITSLAKLEVSAHGFTEENARKVFEMYCIDENNETLQPPDVRKLLLDILESFGWPLVVPDESLDEVFEEMSLNDKTAITWVEFKSFFVFLQDKPLHKLLELVTKGFSQEELNMARLITIEPIEAIENPSFERPLFQHAVEKMLGSSTTSVFIYFLGAGGVLALGIGKFESRLTELRNEEVQIGGYRYNVKIQGFDVHKDMFPPIQRAGGFSSKMARKIADTYMVARQWDQRNLKIGQRTADLAKLAKEKWQEFDDKYKVEQKVNSATQTTVEAVKAFDEKHQISRRLSDTAKSLNEKYEISAKVQSQVNKIKDNEKVQKVSSRVSQIVKSGLDTFDQISKETKQLVNEKEAEHSKPDEKNSRETEDVDEISPGASGYHNEQMPSAANSGGDKAEGAAPGLSTDLQI